MRGNGKRDYRVEHAPAQIESPFLFVELRFYACMRGTKTFQLRGLQCEASCTQMHCVLVMKQKGPATLSGQQNSSTSLLFFDCI